MDWIRLRATSLSEGAGAPGIAATSCKPLPAASWQWSDYRRLLRVTLRPLPPPLTVNFLHFLPPALKRWLKHRAGVITVADRLRNLRRAGFRPRQVIDAGAFRGEWSVAAADVFPEASFLLIEPQPALAAHLQSLCASHPRFRFRGALLGARPGPAAFLLEETNSRVVAADHAPTPGQRIIPLDIATLVDLAAAVDFGDCDFLKLDLQGHELHALDGAGALFGRIEVIQTEVSWLRIGDVPLLEEVLARFRDRGYRPYDVFGANYRPLDGALWQTDFIFVRTDSPLLARCTWS